MWCFCAAVYVCVLLIIFSLTIYLKMEESPFYSHSSQSDILVKESRWYGLVAKNKNRVFSISNIIWINKVLLLLPSYFRNSHNLLFLIFVHYTKEDFITRDHVKLFTHSWPNQIYLGFNGIFTQVGESYKPIWKKKCLVIFPVPQNLHYFMYILTHVI